VWAQLGNLSIWPEYAAAVGDPMGDPSKDSTTGVWSRSYSTGVALVNPTNATQVVALPSGLGIGVAVSWKDLYGGAVADPSKVSLEPASGLVLLHA